MANRLKMAKALSVLELHRLGWSSRRIARELGVHRGTVAAHIRREAATEPNPARAPTGSDPPDIGLASSSSASNPAKALAGSAMSADDVGTAMAGESIRGDPLSEGPPEGLGRGLHTAGPGQGETECRSRPDVGSSIPAGRFSRCWPHRDLVAAMLERGLSAVRIHADLRDEHGVALSYHSVRRFVAALGKASPQPFRRMECAPGEEAQVDFGSGPTLVVDGRRRRTHVLRVVLSHSRKGYAEAVLRQDTESFIRALENAFRHFGGVPRTVVVDNLKAAVLRVDWFDPELNPKIVSFARHHGTTILPTKPRMPRHKGKVERGVGYVQDNGLKGRAFATLAEVNAHLLRWETTVADTRVHGTTRRHVGAHFEAVERAALLPLPEGRFPFFHESRRRVHRDGHVEVAKAYYSAPPEHVGQDVWARWDGRVVRLFDARMTQIAMHAQHEPGRFSTDDRHIGSRKIASVERGAAFLIKQAGRIGPHVEQWAAKVVAERGVEGVRTIDGLRSLARRCRADDIDWACRVATGLDMLRLRDLRRLIVRGGAGEAGGAGSAHEQQAMEFTADDPLIRPLAEYDRLVGAAFRRTTPDPPEPSEPPRSLKPLDATRDEIVVVAS
jgi:transposase